MNTLKIKRNSPWAMLWLMLVSAMFVLGGEAEAALQCYDCHGTRNGQDFRPEDSPFRNPSSGGFQGNHRTHMGTDATPLTCSKCHPGSSSYTSRHSRDSKNKIKVSSLINNSPTTTHYPLPNRTSAFPQTFDKSDTGPAPLGSCYNVNCHFEKGTPQWGSQPLAKTTDNCNLCHAAPPTDGQHPLKSDGITPTKHGKYYGNDINVCRYCHTDHTREKNFNNVSNPFQHATSAGKRRIAVQFTMSGVKAGNYSTAYAGNNFNAYLPSQITPEQLNGRCAGLYCHSDGQKTSPPFNPPNVKPRWGTSAATTQCDSCHRYRGDGFLNMTSNGHGKLVDYRWIRKYPCTYCHGATVNPLAQSGKPPLDNSTNNGVNLIRMGTYSSKHVNGRKDIFIDPYWKIDGVYKTYSAPYYNPSDKVCYNLYCHSDGAADPDRTTYKKFPWNMKGTKCNSCHGHSDDEKCKNCHDGIRTFLIDGTQSVLRVITSVGWPSGQEWKAAMPMYPNEGPGKNRANSHTRHMQSDFSCSDCHQDTIPTGGDCKNCHDGKQSLTSMDEVSHLNAANHVNKKKDVRFAKGGIYNPNAADDGRKKTCSLTDCHTGSYTPQWGDSAGGQVVCFKCHGRDDSAGGDLDIFTFAGYTNSKISLTEWATTGHGRTGAPYPGSGNPAANFPNPTSNPPGNPCWYCHDNNVLHKDGTNPFRLKMHQQFDNRFEKECVFCHMTADTNAECLACHYAPESLAPQLGNISSSHIKTAKWANRTATTIRPDHRSYDRTPSSNSCFAILGCHTGDAWTHNTGPNTLGSWSADQKADVKNQYQQMGVCLQCHDDDSSNKCAECHGLKNPDGSYVYTDPPKYTNISVPKRYKLGYDPGTGYIKPVKARATSAHFGHKHYQDFLVSGGWTKNSDGSYKGTWKGGKFCWDCHDPHGDKNIYMIHDNVATETDGKFGIPVVSKRRPVYFRQKSVGSDYALNAANPVTGKVDGICNVCHSSTTKHYWYPTSGTKSGDSHNSGNVCTKCHEHRFSDSHADGQSCNTCHQNKPVPRHLAFGQPVDCIICHSTSLGTRTNIIEQFKGASHHVQGIPISNRQCYQCHWESTAVGTVNSQYHDGYSFATFTSVKNAKVDLVIYGPNGVRPTAYRLTSSASGRATASQFTAVTFGGGDLNAERTQAGKITNHCLGCHSDQNNYSKPFNDCKTPRQYAWDKQSVASRYSQTGTTKWGKYSSTTVNAKYKVTKALSAHGNAANNQGGWDPVYGTDQNIADYRPGNNNVQCFDCHNSHGSRTNGITTSYVSYSGLKNGGNLKQTKIGEGGYLVEYTTSPGGSTLYNGVIINSYNNGAGLCFDCHMTAVKAAAGTSGTPWGYQSTFGALRPIKGYLDAYYFGDRNYAGDPNGPSIYKLGGGANNFTFKQSKNIVGGHMHASKPLTTAVSDSINGLCTPCHDPHGVSPTMGAKQNYGVPMLKGTWLSSPFKEDLPPPDPTSPAASNPDPNNSVPPTNYSIPSNPAGYVSWGQTKYYGYTPEYRNSPNFTFPPGSILFPPGTKLGMAPPATYNIDRNTFGAISSGAIDGKLVRTRRLTETDTQFAGLCMRCHTKKAIMGRYTSSINSTHLYRPNLARWSSVARIHASNSGWGTNREHSFTCSKCHQPHNSALPRLMKTNCLDYKHRGGRQSGGVPWNARMTQYLAPASTRAAQVYYPQNRNQVRGYPIASLYGTNDFMPKYDNSPIRPPIPVADASCHLTRPGTGITPNNTWAAPGTVGPGTDYGTTSPAVWPDYNNWNRVTPW